MQISSKPLHSMVHKLRWILLILFLANIDGPVYGQTPRDNAQKSITISGVVSTEDGEPLAGVTVYSKSIANGVITNDNGRYSIQVPEGSTLAISFVSYKTVEIVATVGGDFNAVMKSQSTDLDAVVTVAYSTQKKETVTGAVASISTSELKQSSSANLSAALAGRLPGLTTIQSSGQPGRDDVAMYIRGAATINGQSPLILIDGVPRDNISTLDPNEIATVSILKDASATAVFGVRGANGVILITTRRGEMGKPELSVSADFSMQAFIAQTDRIHSWDYAELYNQARRNSGADDMYTPYMIEKYKSGDDPNFYPDRDVQNEIFRKWAPQTRVNVNLTGGSDKLQYFMNVSYLNQGGNFKTEPKSKLGYDPSFKLDRYNFRTNLDYKVSKSFKAFLNLGSYLEKMNTPPIIVHTGYDHLVNHLVQLSWEVPPTSPGPVTVAGYGVPGDQVVTNNATGYGFMNRSGYRSNTRTNLNGSLGAEWDLSMITKGLSTKGMVSYDTRASSTLQGTTEYDEYTAFVATTAAGTNGYTVKSANKDTALKYNKSYDSNFYVNLQYFINYQRTFGKHDVSGMFLAQRDNWEKENGDIPYNLVGISARTTYAYDLRYLAEFNMGYNGSEQFNPEKRFGFFPAFSAGWVVSNESFLKNNKIVTNLKLRASYGKVGNDKMGSRRFMYLDQISLGGGGMIPSLTQNQQINQGLIGNKEVTWETSWKQNFGVDLKIIDDITLTADYFIENREKILISRGLVPSIIGVQQGNLPSMNLGKVENKGFEIELGYNKQFNEDLNVIAKVNYAYNKNVQEYMDEAILGSDYAYRFRKTGYSINQNWGYIRDFSNGGNGYINTLEELDALPKYEIGTPGLGDFKYVDVNGDGAINEKDIVPIGYSNIPRVTYGASLAVTYKGFDFSVLFQGIAKVSQFYEGKGVYETGEGAGYFTGYHLNAWTAERYDNGEKITYPALSTVVNTNHKANDFFIMDRSFVRLKNIEIGYTLPEKTLKAAGVSRLRIYVSGQNLVTWNHLLTNAVDPEQGGATSYPMTKMISGGINLVF